MRSDSLGFSVDDMAKMIGFTGNKPFEENKLEG